MKLSFLNTITPLSLGEGLEVRFLILITLITIHSSLITIAQSPEWIIYDKSNVSGIYIEKGSYSSFVAVDDSNRIWSDLNRDGIAVFDGQNWIGINDYWDSTRWWNIANMNDIAFNFQNSIWISADGELTKLTPGIDTMHINFLGFDSLEGNPSTRIRSYGLATDGNNLWVGTDTGLVGYDGTNWSFYNRVNGRLPVDYVTWIAIDGYGNLWLASDSGLVKWDSDTTWQIWNASNSPIPGNSISTLGIDNENNVWLICNILNLSDKSARLFKFNGNNWTVYDTTNSGLPKDSMGHLGIPGSIAIDKQNIKWLASGRGLIKFDDTNWTIYSIPGADTNFRKNWISDVAVDSLGNIWMATYHGLVEFNETGIVTSIEKKDGDVPFSISTFYPNPSDKTVKVKYSVEKSGKVQCEVYDSGGRFIGKYLNKYSEAGEYEASINTSGLSPGVYLFKMKIGNRTEVKKVVVK